MIVLLDVVVDRRARIAGPNRGFMAAVRGESMIV